MISRFRILLAGAACVALGACNLAPAYHAPALAPLPAQFKEAPGWRAAAPADAAAKGEWWRLFGDPALDALVARVEVTNQTVAQYRAAWAAARALTQQAQAARLPAITGSAGTSKSGGSTSTAATSANAGIAASWTVDLWDKLGNAASQARASEQASAGDLANATLAARSELASDYLSLRGADARSDELDATVIAYRKALTITQNKYRAGTVARADIEQAQTALSNAEADRRDLDRQRAVLEHAIAVLVGENPSTFALAPARWNPAVPEVPAILPADLLERRPDIAAAERRVAAANAGIGIQRAAYFPQLALSASGNLEATSVGNLLSAPLSLWSLGASALGTLFDFGATRAKVAAARAQTDQAAAAYRQTVLGAFQQVEDNLAAAAAYADEARLRDEASAAADRAETIARNQYLAGLVDYGQVVVAQTSAYSARQARIQAVVARQTTAVALIAAIGGQWRTAAPAP